MDMQNQFLSRFDRFIESRSAKENTPVNVHDSFGREVADGLSLITDDYTREVAKREIRDIIFKARFGNRTINEPYSFTPGNTSASDSYSYTSL